MLKFNMQKGVVTSTPFQIEDSEGVTSLFFTQNTISDSLRLARIQNKVLANDKLSEDEASEGLSLARIVCTVKNEKGEYHWNENIEELYGVFSGDMFFAMLTKCAEVNPSPLEGIDFTAKKK